MLLILARGTGGQATSDASATSRADTFGDGLPDPIVAPNDGLGRLTTFLPWLGVGVLVAAVLLFLGAGWARPLLAGLGILAVTGLVAVAVWVAVVALALLVLGSVCGLRPAAHRYLRHTVWPPASAGLPRRARPTTDR